MVALLIRKLMLTVLLALLVVTLLERFNPSPPPMILDFHHADFPVCAIVHNGPLRPAPPKIDGAPPTSEID